MNKYKITLLLIPVFYSSFCNSGDTNTITYGYDKLSSEIYATNGDIKNAQIQVRLHRESILLF